MERKRRTSVAGSGASTTTSLSRKKHRLSFFAVLCPVLLVVVMTLASQLLLHFVLTSQFGNSAAINHSGRQRMLSQRIGLNAVVLATQNATCATAPAALATDAQRELVEVAHTQLCSDVDLFAGTFAALRAGSGQYPRPSEEVAAMYDALVPYQREVEEFGRAACAHSCPWNATSETEQDMSSFVASKHAATVAFFPRMNAIVNKLDVDALAAQERLLMLTWIAMSVTILAVCAELWLFTIPVVRRVQELRLANRVGRNRRMREVARLQAQRELQAWLAHEIKNPLAGIHAMLEFVREQIEDMQRDARDSSSVQSGGSDSSARLLPDSSAHGLLEFRDASLATSTAIMTDVLSGLELTEHMRQILTNLLDFAKLQAGQLELNAAPLQLDRDVLLPACSLLRHTLSPETVILVDGGSPPLHVLGDKLRLTQIVVNFLVNATRHCRSGYILVRARRPNTKHGASGSVRSMGDQSGSSMTSAFVASAAGDWVDSSKTQAASGLALSSQARSRRRLPRCCSRVCSILSFSDDGGVSEEADVSVLPEEEEHDITLQDLFDAHDEGMQNPAMIPSTEDSSGLLALEVCDTGPGVPPDLQDQLFTKFVRIGGHGGNGLGLAMNKTLSEMMGGTAGVISPWKTKNRPPNIRARLGAPSRTQQDGSPTSSAGRARDPLMTANLREVDAVGTVFYCRLRLPDVPNYVHSNSTSKTGIRVFAIRPPRSQGLKDADAPQSYDTGSAGSSGGGHASLGDLEVTDASGEEAKRPTSLLAIPRVTVAKDAGAQPETIDTAGLVIPKRSATKKSSGGLVLPTFPASKKAGQRGQEAPSSLQHSLRIGAPTSSHTSADSVREGLRLSASNPTTGSVTAAASTVRVLLVDDVKVNRMIIERRLKGVASNLGLRVQFTHAANGEIAMEEIDKLGWTIEMVSMHAPEEEEAMPPSPTAPTQRPTLTRRLSMSGSRVLPSKSQPVPTSVSTESNSQQSQTRGFAPPTVAEDAKAFDVIVMDEYMQGAGGVAKGSEVLHSLEIAQYPALRVHCSANNVLGNVSTCTDGSMTHKMSANVLWGKPFPSVAEMQVDVEEAMKRAVAADPG